MWSVWKIISEVMNTGPNQIQIYPVGGVIFHDLFCRMLHRNQYILHPPENDSLGYWL